MERNLAITCSRGHVGRRLPSLDAHTLRNYQTAIFQYFSSLSLPGIPTIYDHLLLSLRPKDVIATF